MNFKKYIDYYNTMCYNNIYKDKGGQKMKNLYKAFAVDNNTNKQVSTFYYSTYRLNSKQNIEDAQNEFKKLNYNNITFVNFVKCDYETQWEYEHNIKKYL